MKIEREIILNLFEISNPCSLAILFYFSFFFFFFEKLNSSKLQI